MPMGPVAAWPAWHSGSHWLLQTQQSDTAPDAPDALHDYLTRDEIQDLVKSLLALNMKTESVKRLKVCRA